MVYVELNQQNSRFDWEIGLDKELMGIIGRLQTALAGNDAALADLAMLVATGEKIVDEAQLDEGRRIYNREIASALGAICPSPTYYMHSSWPHGTPQGDLHNVKLLDVAIEFECGLLEDLEMRGVSGCLAEFGIYHGSMLERLVSKLESLGSKRQVYGFDSFEGLSEPSAQADYEHWYKGQYAASYETVFANLRVNQRPQLTLVKGWLEQSLQSAEAQAIDSVAYARIDVDIHDPTRDCLKFLTHRLADGAILAFDDWTYSTSLGESKAFFDWMPSVPHLRFEWLGQAYTRFYLRVHRR